MGAPDIVPSAGNPRLRLLTLLGRSRRSIVVTSALGLLQSAVLIPVALLVRRLFNVAIPHHQRGAIVLIGVAIAALTLLAAAVGSLAQDVASRMARTVVADLRKDLVRRLYAQPPAWFDRQDPRALHLTVVQHTERLSDVLNRLGAVAIPSAAAAIGLGVVMVILDPLLTACVVAAAPAYILVARGLGGRSRRHYREWLAAHVRFGVGTNTALRTMALAHVHGAEAWEVRRHNRAIDEVVARSRHYDTVLARYTGMQAAITGLGGVAALVVGGLSVSDGSLSLGDLLAFYSLAAMLLRQTGSAVSGIASASINAEALAEVEALTAEHPPPPRRGAVLTDFNGRVGFEDVSFAYAGTPVLSQVSFAVASGEHVALVGPSGSGKTTIVRLLLGLYVADRGTVSVDGVPINDVDLDSLRRQIGVIMQNTVVFPGTIRENIVYGRDGIDEPSIDAAVRHAGLWDFIARLPDGYEHAVGDDGGLVSGGQRQRIGIARALLGNPRMLVLDEPTLHLDAAAIDRLLGTLEELRCTIITVTHDPQVAARADRVIQIRDGRLVTSPPAQPANLLPT